MSLTRQKIKVERISTGLSIWTLLSLPTGLRLDRFTAAKCIIKSLSVPEERRRESRQIGTHSQKMLRECCAMWTRRGFIFYKCKNARLLSAALILARIYASYLHCLVEDVPDLVCGERLASFLEPLHQVSHWTAAAQLQQTTKCDLLHFWLSQPIFLPIYCLVFLTMKR